jgi:hypothetical protein
MKTLNILGVLHEKIKNNKKYIITAIISFTFGILLTGLFTIRTFSTDNTIRKELNKTKQELSSADNTIKQLRAEQFTAKEIESEYNNIQSKLATAESGLENIQSSNDTAIKQLTDTNEDSESVIQQSIRICNALRKEIQDTENDNNNNCSNNSNNNSGGNTHNTQTN